jgi:hypothetical protein
MICSLHQNEMGRECSTCGRRERCICGFDKENWGKDLEDVVIDGRIILRWIFKKWDRRTDWIALAQETETKLVNQQLTLSRRYSQLASVASLCVRNPRHRSSSETVFARKICSWTELFVNRGVREPRFHCNCISWLLRMAFGPCSWSVRVAH